MVSCLLENDNVRQSPDHVRQSPDYMRQDHTRQETLMRVATLLCRVKQWIM